VSELCSSHLVSELECCTNLADSTDGICIFMFITVTLGKWDANVLWFPQWTS
jgi:hypothetical protein